jgi:aminopeptidase 2
LALELTPRTLQVSEKIFAEPYPLPKMDLIAVPGAPGATEAWGLIVFLESILLAIKGRDECRGVQVGWLGACS